MFQGGELVSKTDCGGFDSLLSMPTIKIKTVKAVFFYYQGY